MNTILVFLYIIAVTAADISHVANNFLPPSRLPNNELVETTIEKHEVIELPTQIEIVKEGQPIYGVHSMSSIGFGRMSPNAELRRRYMDKISPSHESEILKPPAESDGAAHEKPMRWYLPPVLRETPITDLPNPTTEIPTDTADMPITSPMPMMTETTTTEQASTLAVTTTKIPIQEHIVEATTIPTLWNHYLPSMLPNKNYPTPTEMLSNKFLPPIMLQNQYLTPTIEQTKYSPPVFVENGSLQSETNKNQILPPEHISSAKPQNLYFLPAMSSKDFSLLSGMPENQYIRTNMLEERILQSPTTESHILPSPRALENDYQLPTTRWNQYLSPVKMMLPPSLPPMPQPTYQQYQEKLLRDQRLLHPKKQESGIADAISEMEQQPLQMQPVAPVEPAHLFSEGGYHYKTGEEDLNHFHYNRQRR